MRGGEERESTAASTGVSHKGGAVGQPPSSIARPLASGGGVLVQDTDQPFSLPNLAAARMPSGAGPGQRLRIARSFDLFYLRKPAFVVEAVNPILIHPSRHAVAATRLYDKNGSFEKPVCPCSAVRFPPIVDTVSLAYDICMRPIAGETERMQVRYARFWSWCTVTGERTNREARQLISSTSSNLAGGQL
jgi:hypothetical protein